MKRGQRVSVVTLSVSARWLIEHRNRTDVPRPPQQPGDPQVKTKQRRGVDWPLPPLPSPTGRPSEAHYTSPSVVDSSCQPCPGQTIFLCSPSSMRQQLSLTLHPPFPPAERILDSPLSLQPQQHFQPPRLRSREWRSSPCAL